MVKVLRVSPVLVERAREEVRQLTAARKPVSEGLRRVSQVALVTDDAGGPGSVRTAPHKGPHRPPPLTSTPAGDLMRIAPQR